MDKNYTSMNSFLSRFDHLSRQMGFKATDSEQFSVWRTALRAELRRLIGLDRLGMCDPKAEIVERVQKDGYRRDKLLLQTEDGVTMPVYVLIPDDTTAASSDGRLPVMVAPHGHGFGGMHSVAGLSEIDAVAARIQACNCDYGLQLVREGFIVFCPEARGFGQRRESLSQGDENFMHSSCAQLNSMATPLGITVTGMWTHDLARLLDYIEGRTDCDAGRIGCAGLSGGGLQTLWLAALDDRIRCSVISGYFYGVKDSLLVLSGNCSCNYVPGLWEKVDMGDIGALIAPRPILVETGSRDDLNGERGVTNVVEQLEITKRAYALFGREDDVQHDIFDGEHMWHGTKALPFLKSFV
jgi:dienelactone hydrolase